MCDITDEEFENLYLTFYNNFEKYMTNYIIPDVVAFYLANSYSRNRLCNSSLYNHINSARDVFNIQCNIEELIPQIENILRIKYNLKIINNNPLKLNKFM